MTDARACTAFRVRIRRSVSYATACSLAAAFLGGYTQPASAIDGCLVMLCLSGDWKSVPECSSPVNELFDFLSAGHSFPGCEESGTSTIRALPADLPHCPEMYQRIVSESGARECIFDGRIEITNTGAPWATVWWSKSDLGSSTRYSPFAIEMLGAARDMRYETDLASWGAATPPSDPPYGDGGP